MSRHKWTVTLADCQQAVLPVVLGDADATENATEYFVRPMGIDAAVAIEPQDARHLPTASKLTSVRKCRGTYIGRKWRITAESANKTQTLVQTSHNSIQLALSY